MASFIGIIASLLTIIIIGILLLFTLELMDQFLNEYDIKLIHLFIGFICCGKNVFVIIFTQTFDRVESIKIVIYLFEKEKSFAKF